MMTDMNKTDSKYSDQSYIDEFVKKKKARP